MNSKIENSKESTNKVFRDLKARNKVRMKHFKVTVTRVRVLRGYQETTKLLLAF